jgi:hypothetical protein
MVCALFVHGKHQREPATVMRAGLARRESQRCMREERDEHKQMDNSKLYLPSRNGIDGERETGNEAAGVPQK